MPPTVQCDHNVVSVEKLIIRLCKNLVFDLGQMECANPVPQTMVVLIGLRTSLQ